MIWFVISLLSMGAVFGIFAAFYNWAPMMTGYKYNELLGKIQFWLFFIGVNILFFPLHFLGLSGMPRRIPDYPDIFIGWNKIASMGSFITLISVFLFLYILYDQLINKVPHREYTSSYFINKNISTNLEFTALHFPPQYHTYSQLPVL